MFPFLSHIDCTINRTNVFSAANVFSFFCRQMCRWIKKQVLIIFLTTFYVLLIRAGDKYVHSRDSREVVNSRNTDTRLQINFLTPTVAGFWKHSTMCAYHVSATVILGLVLSALLLIRFSHKFFDEFCRSRQLNSLLLAIVKSITASFAFVFFCLHFATYLNARSVDCWSFIKSVVKIPHMCVSSWLKSIGSGDKTEF